MNINPLQMMKIKESIDRFTAAHPKVMPFFQAIMREGIDEGSIIEMKVTTAQGRSYVSSIRVTAEDMELFRQLKSGM